MTATAPRATQSPLHDGHRRAAKDLVRAVGLDRARELVADWADEDRRYLLVRQAMDEAHPPVPSTGALNW